MTPERWSQIKEIFALAAAAPLDQRPSFVAHACHGDSSLESELTHLLAQCDAMGGFLESPAFSTGLLAPGDVLCHRYEIVKFLGAGGMGEVYEAADRGLGENVAIKLIHHDAGVHERQLAQFRCEVQLARRVTHRNVCRIFDIAVERREEGLITFLTMELLHGETLSARLQRDGRLKEEDAKTIASQLCQGLEAAHHAGVLHCDFKCSNIMLAGQGKDLRAILMDFGIARGLQAANDLQSGNTSMIPALGSPAYTSPEQLLRKPLTAATDLYSLGVVLFEMITGVRPFYDQSAMAEALRRLVDDPPSPSDFVDGLEKNWNETILRCLQRDPARRFHSPGEIAEALGNTGLVMRRRRLFVTLGAVMLLVVFFVTVFHGRRPASLPEKRYIAVLPFDSVSSNAGDQAAAEGLAESLSNDLAQLGNSGGSFWIVPWSEVQNRAKYGTGQIASSLGVNLLIGGTVERQMGKMRMRVFLKDAATMKQLRFAQWDVPQAEMATMEDTLLEQLCAILQLQLRPEMRRSLPVNDSAIPGIFEYYEQGKGYLARRNAQSTDQAISLLQKVIEKDRSFGPAYAELALAFSWKYRNTKDPQWYAQAKKACTQALSMNDRLARAHLALGSITMDSGHPEESIRELERTLELEPANNDAMNLLPRAYDAEGRTLQAETLLKEAIKQAPGSWVNYNDLGYFYFRHAQYQQSEALFRVATELAPDNPRAFSNLGGVYLALGKYAEAKSVLVRAAALNPTAATYSNLGTASFRLGQYGESADMFRKAAELQPGDDRLWRNLGDAYSLSPQTSEAAAAYARAIEVADRNLMLRPKDGQLLENIAHCYAKLGRKRDAEKALAKADAVARRDPEFLFTSAVVHELTGQRGRAVALLCSAIRAGYSAAEIEHAPELSQLRGARCGPELSASTSINLH
jgi:serine/threonine protein kinase/tetratricopeptide (TPR) repeat protein